MKYHFEILRNIFCFSLWITGFIILIKYPYPVQILNKTNFQTTFPPKSVEDMVVHSGPLFQRLEDNLFLIAAFYDSRKTPAIIRVLSAAILGADHGELTCKLLHEQPSIPGTLMKFEDGDVNNTWGCQPSWITCPVSLDLNGISSLPFHKDLVIISSREPANFLPVNFDFDGTPKYKVAACIQPLYNYHDPLELIEWIEFHKLLGVEHFTFYNMSVGSNVSEVLKSYVSKGEITLHKWNLPSLAKDMSYNGQILQINHCLYSYIGKAEMVFSHDLDEFVVPGVNTLGNFTNYYEFFSPMFNTLDEGKQVAMIKFPARFSFAHLPRMSPNKGNGLASKLRFTSRVSSIASTGFIYMDKWIAKPHLLIEAEVHFSTTLSPNTTSIWIPDDKAHFIHFRNCTDDYVQMYCLPEYYNCTHRKCEDVGPTEVHVEYALVFGDLLVARVLDKLHEMKYDTERL